MCNTVLASFYMYSLNSPKHDFLHSEGIAPGLLREYKIVSEDHQCLMITCPGGEKKGISFGGPL